MTDRGLHLVPRVVGLRLTHLLLSALVVASPVSVALAQNSGFKVGTFPRPHTYWPDRDATPGCMETFGLAPPRAPDDPPYSCALVCDGQPTLREGTQDRCKEIGPNTWQTFDYNPNTKEWHPGGQGPVGGTTCRVETGPADPTLPIFRTIYPAGHPRCARWPASPTRARSTGCATTCRRPASSSPSPRETMSSRCSCVWKP